MTDDNNHGIANVKYVFGDGKAIRSESDQHGTMWFFREAHDEPIKAYNVETGKFHNVNLDTVQRNIDHEQTHVETVPVEDAPVGVTAGK